MGNVGLLTCVSVQGELNDRNMHHLTYTASRHMYGRNFGDVHVL